MRLIFCHIPKVAGKSVLGNIQKYLPAERTIKIYDVGGDIKPRDFHAFALPEDWLFLVGHIHLGTLLSNQGLRNSEAPTTLFSSVRDPIDRMVSLYNFISNRPQHPEYDIVKKMKMQKFVANCPENVQTRYLSDPDGHIPPHWEIHIVPIDRVDEAAATLTGQVMNRELSMDAFKERHNVTAELVGDKVSVLQTRADLPQKFISRMYDKHKLDMELYQRALKAGRLSALPSI